MPRSLCLHVNKRLCIVARLLDKIGLANVTKLKYLETKATNLNCINDEINKLKIEICVSCYFIQ